MKILALEDNVNTINDIRKFVKKFKIHQINIPNKNKFLIEDEGVEFFSSLDVIEQIKEVNTIKDEYDVCIVSSWTTSRIAYLAGLRYIIYFVGNDIRIPPFVKNSKPYYFKKPVNKLNFLQRVFYKHVLDSAIACVASSEETFNQAKRYRKDVIRIDRTIVNTKLINMNIQPLKRIKTKFTFFCPQRIGLEKGTDVIWKAFQLCKSDFIVLQVEWFDETSDEAKIMSQKILKDKPNQVELIPKIKREDIARYFTFADGIIGQMQIGLLNNTEREAALCKKPVICYYDSNMKYIIDGKEITAPFLPTSKKPEQIAKIIDKTVDSKLFREKLAVEEFEFVKELCDPYKAAAQWESIFEDVNGRINKRKVSQVRMIGRNFLFFISHKLILNKKIELQ